MKKLLLLTSLLLIPTVIPVQAQEIEEIESQIEQLQVEIDERLKQIETLKLELPKSDAVGSETNPIKANGLKMWFEMMTVKNYDEGEYLIESEDGKLLIVIVHYESADESTVTIDPDDFRLYLADIQYPKTNYLDYSLDAEAVPPGVQLEGYLMFDLPTHIADAKDLVFEYEPRENIFMKEEVLFGINVNDFINEQ